ncbi:MULTISPECIES: hypothetical protein [unclassified Bradyrhizobium]|uniref:hypothetical protein n=1 Tax=unclassified Bradyrhizobium TaxID=2631580 RepID=UPI001FFC1816|nr:MULTISPECIES: hypothetical protein [unclassified Bradyrhizobium]MCK1521654.1 hypothetical protein [Bradyrhizobium sp. 17]MCK1684456.1 hypothetical protein [Bradyrhizobium sp. 145]
MLLLLGLASVIWSAVTLPAFRSAAPAKDVTARILADDRFKSATLSEVLASILASPKPIVERSDLPRAEALVRLRIAEEAIGRKDPDQADRDVTAADERLRLVLAFNPTDSFSWLMLYSGEVLRNGFEDSTVAFLEQSYASGPLEGWIALRRNRLALAAFGSLSESMQARVVAEFASLVNSDFVQDAALILMGIGWLQKERLLASLSNVDAVPREAFAKGVRREGLIVSVPGVSLDERHGARD